METRAHFIIIGLFTLGGILGGLVFFIWLASVQIDRQYSQYGVLFEDVAGLDQSADVLFNGVSVGRVTSIRIWEDNPSFVYVGIEIDAETPVRVDTIAQLESLGLTGVAYIALTGGSPDAALLVGTENTPPLISSQRSSFQALVSGAPDILNDAADLMEQLQAITGPENQERVQHILQNVEAATAELDTALSDFSEISNTVSEATEQITTFTDQLESLSASAQSTLTRADEALAGITETAEEADTTIAAMRPAIENANSAFEAIDRLATNDLPPLSDKLTTTLTNTDTALASADQAFRQADTIMATDLGPVLADLREATTAFSAAMTSVATDGAAVMSDIRNVVDQIQSGVTAATPGLRDFGQLGSEARSLVRALSNLVSQISSDPARFLLDDRVPEYRR